MNSQLIQLQASIEHLVSVFNNVLAQKQALAEEVDRLNQQQQHLVAEFNTELEATRQKHDTHVFHMESHLQQVITQLRHENHQYQDMLRQSAQEIQELLQRLPAQVAEEER